MELADEALIQDGDDHVLSGTSLTAETGATTISQPNHEWPIAEGTGTTANDTIGADTATLSGTANWGAADGPEVFSPYRQHRQRLLPGVQLRP